MFYGHYDDFINECVDAFFEASDNVWDTYKSYITEGYDEDDTSIIEESAETVAFAAENLNDFFIEEGKLKDFAKRHKKKLIAAGVGAAALGGAGIAAHKRDVKALGLHGAEKEGKFKTMLAGVGGYRDDVANKYKETKSNITDKYNKIKGALK